MQKVLEKRSPDKKSEIFFFTSYEITEKSYSLTCGDFHRCRHFSPGFPVDSIMPELYELYYMALRALKIQFSVFIITVYTSFDLNCRFILYNKIARYRPGTKNDEK